MLKMEKMENEKKKRVRAANFSMAEERLLVECVQKFKGLVENKKTDTVTNKEKEAAWEKIGMNFNACSGTIARTAKTLKLKYEGMKKKLKKKVAANRQEYYKTGGGEGSQISYNDVETKVLGLCSLIDGLENRRGTDEIEEPLAISPRQLLDDTKEEAFFNDMIEISVSPPPTPEVIIQEIEDNPKIEVAMDMEKDIPSCSINHEESSGKWLGWNPTSLKTPLSRPLKVNKKRKMTTATTSSFEALAAARLQVVEMQKELVLTEIKEKKANMNFAQEEHEFKIMCLANEEKRRAEEHEIKMKTYKQSL